MCTAFFCFIGALPTHVRKQKTLDFRRFAIKALVVGGFARARSLAQRGRGRSRSLSRAQPAVKISDRSWFWLARSCPGATSMPLVEGSLDHRKKFMPGHIAKNMLAKSPSQRRQACTGLENDWRRWPPVSTRGQANITLRNSIPPQ